MRRRAGDCAPYLDMIEIQFTEQAAAVLRKYERLPEAALRAIAAGMDEQNQFTVSHIQARYLSFPKGGPSVPHGLRVQSNRLRGSIRASKAVISGQSVTSSIGSNVKYAAIHEFGGRTPARVIKAKSGKALKFTVGGKIFLRKSVKHPGSVMPERAFIRNGMRDMAGDYRAVLSRKILEAEP